MTELERFLVRRYRETADHVFLIGSTPWEVDEALVAYGFPVGPFLAEDEAGLDQTEAADRHGPLPGRMLALGKLGRKTGAGWYRYPGGGGAVEDPIVADLALEEAYFAGLTRKDFSETDIQERVLLGLMCAGFDAISAGVDPDEVDRASVSACGFPEHLHGPLSSQFTRTGGASVTQRLAELSVEGPHVWTLPHGFSV